MGDTMDQARFSKGFFEILSETFETHHGIYLDADTSLFETLDELSAEQASVPVGGRCATLAAQVKHVDFYLEVLERYVQTGDAGKNDWDEIWNTVNSVTPAEWDKVRAHLRETYDRVVGTLRSLTSWDNERSVDGALSIVVHSAYHLGEIRQALCTLR